MKINAVLQKYPELERPEAVFDITNIALSYLAPNLGISESKRPLLYAKKELFTMAVNCNVKPPYNTTWFEYKWGKNTRGVLVSIDENITTYDTFFIGKDETSRLEKVRLKMDNFIFTSHIYTECFTYRPATELEKINKEHDEDYKILYTKTFVLPVIISQSLLNCKNVSTDAHDFPNRRSISHYKKTGKPYFEKYYTLKVKLPGKKHTAGNGENGGWSNAFHIYRGHFKTYTEAAPLFGKFIGTYWWESGIRGNLETGIIDKDYELEVGE